MKQSILLCLILAIGLSACAIQPAAQAIPTATTASPTSPAPVNVNQPVLVTDSLGRQVSLPKPPTRIAISGKAWIIVADAVYMFPEAPDRIIALANVGQGGSNFISLIDSQYKTKAVLQQDVGAEQLAAVKPDLVILKSYLFETIGKQLDALNIPAVYVDFETPEQYVRDLSILGKVFQNENRAQQLTAYYQNKVANIQAAVKNVNKKPRVLLLYFSEKDGAVAFNVPPMIWMQTQMVQMAAGEPVWASANPVGGWTKANLEQIAAWDADQIFIISYSRNPSGVVSDLKADAQWQKIRAVKDGNLFAFPADIYSWDQSDSRWILGLSWLSARLNPQQFPQFDIIQEAQSFYQSLYGLDANFFETKIRPTLKGDFK